MITGIKVPPDEANITFFLEKTRDQRILTLFWSKPEKERRKDEKQFSSCFDLKAANVWRLKTTSSNIQKNILLSFECLLMFFCSHVQWLKSSRRCVASSLQSLHLAGPSIKTWTAAGNKLGLKSWHSWELSPWQSVGLQWCKLSCRWRSLWQVYDSVLLPAWASVSQENPPEAPSTRLWDAFLYKLTISTDC